MTWNLRYAPHLGYRPPFDPLFCATVGSDDPVAHIEFARDQGFAGVLYAAARARTVDEQHRVGEALARNGLEAGCLLYTTFDKLRTTMWAVDTRNARDAIAAELRLAIDAARRIGAKRLAVLGGSDPERPMAKQHAAFTRNLRFAAEIAASAGVTLCLETLSNKSVPDMLLQHIADAYAIVRAVDHPAVRLIFDTSHVQIMDGDLLANLEATWDAIDIVQFADNPGRTEPGSGEINFESVLRLLHRLQYRGLVELEHGWLRPGTVSERNGLTLLRELDAAATRPFGATAGDES
ncbi:TIM barrel protein [Variovorax sp. J22R115]|uniref:TIM barrel protein n=1 Tax=Variovorax sp. J22R115 TaxID=3053509 RepID=UPI002577110F|nr:TIM barrel protein [Variovorax sp. J22R115]MDM0050532.1 TIM barrel protein [Variovorax sp. J22R115]